MSGLAGVVHFDGRPVTRALLECLTAAAPHCGPDGTRHWIGEGDDGAPAVGLSHQRMVTTTRAWDAQPLHDAPARLAVTFDGRLDNRDEIGAALGIAPSELNTRGDAWLALRAYARWGGNCVGHLLGDFAFAIWDRAARRLFCARDPMGIRPLFYHHAAGRRVLFGSEMRQLLALGDVPREPNPGMIAEYLARAVTHCGDTLFAGIHRLPHGSTLTVDSTGLRLHRYWSAEPPAELRYRRDEEHAEHFFELFGRAVGSRLDAGGTVAVSCGGGIDSSAVVGMTRALGSRGTVPPVELFCQVFPEHPDADERGYAEDVARFHALPLHLVEPQPPDAEDYRQRMVRRADLLELPGDQMSQSMMTAIRQRGMRVLLAGAGGDQGFYGTRYHYADLIRRLRLVALVRRLVTDAQSASAWHPSSLVIEGVWPLTPRWLKACVRPAARRWRGYRGYPSWIADTFATAVNLEQRLRPPRDETVAGPRAVQEIRRHYTSGRTQYFIDAGGRCAAEWGLEERHPFYDRRVVEFALSIPDDQRWRGTLTRYVVRQALADHLPASVRWRRDKADFTHYVVESLTALGGRRLFEHLEVASMGWVDQHEVTRLYAELERQLAAGEDDYDIFPLWMVAAVELWFRAMFGPEPAGSALAESVAVGI